MGTQAYPRSGRSLSQLVFALNEELKHTIFSPSFTLDEVSQLDRDISTALATIRQWKNSFAHIHRVPCGILALIPTHLPPMDRLRASLVCRRWRRTFLQYPQLWSLLYPTMGEACLKTFLERAKGSPLTVISSCTDPVDIQRFSETLAGPLPLLHTITIDLHQDPGDPEAMISPSAHLFSGAVNLKEFLFRSKIPSSLNHFVFPNLTMFEFWAGNEGFYASQLLDFLDASPMLRTVTLVFADSILPENIPQERVVVLPNVEIIFMLVNEGGAGYRIAAHMSCPSTRLTSFLHWRAFGDAPPEEIFPNPVPWDAIARQYSGSPPEEVTFELEIAQGPTIRSCLKFHSPDETDLRLDFRVSRRDFDDALMPLVVQEMYSEVLLQASRIIRNHPLVANISLLHFYHSSLILGSAQVRCLANEVRQLFASLGPLEELGIYSCDVRPYLASFFTSQESYKTDEPILFPPTKKLVISHPLYPSRAECVTAIVGLARSQHARGVPFKHVTVYMENPPAEMAARLQPWVGEAHCKHNAYVVRDGLPI